jgi:hypothetical protein
MGLNTFVHWHFGWSEEGRITVQKTIAKKKRPMWPKMIFCQATQLDKLHQRVKHIETLHLVGGVK